MYIADTGNNAVKEIPADGSGIVTIGSGFSGPTGVAVDAAGNVFVADYGNGVVKEVPADGSPIVKMGSGFNSPYGIAVDKQNKVYVADNYYSNRSVTQTTPVGGYYLDKPLPRGLSLNTVTGVVSGTPTIISPATNYTITGYNTSGSAAATVNIKVYSQLAGLALSNVTLSPAFAGTMFNYTDTVANTVTGTTVTPTLADPNAHVTVNGQPLNSGSASQNIPLVIGSNTISVVVPGADGVTTQTYTVTITRLPENADLAALAISSGTLSPAFAAATTSYTVSVANNIAGITLTPTVSGTGATAKVNGVTVASGTPSASLPLALGLNTITTVVTSAGGGNTKTYTLVITRAESGNALLTKITTNSGVALTPVAGPDYKDYAITAPSSLTSITVTPTVQDATAVVRVNGVIIASGTASAAIPLAEDGTIVINTVVTAQDGITQKTYSIAVTRRPPPDASLINLASNAGAISPVFSAGTTNYTLTVPNTTTSITVAPTAADVSSTIKVNGATVASGSASAAVTLNAGTNSISAVVTARDGITTKTYILVVTRPTNNALLASIKTTPSETLTSVTPIGGAYRSYTTTVPSSLASIQVTATAQDAGATITINGTAVASGAASPAITLATGANVINTVVTSSDGSATDTYTITVNKPSANALLTKITTNSGVALTTVTGPDYKDYSLNVPNATASITITPITQDATATVKVNGTTVASGTASAIIPLQAGANTITTVVTAQDGATTKTYGITVTRAAMMALYAPKDSVAADSLVVHPGITPNGDGINDIFTIDGINAFPDNKVTIMGRSGAVIYEAKGYDNQTKFFDGHSSKNGALQLPGTYFYSLEYSSNGKTKVKTGFLVLKY